MNETKKKTVIFQIKDMLSRVNRERIEKYGAVFENGHDFLELMDNIIALLEEQDNCENCAIAIEDRQLVVRCKDCKHLFDGEHTKNCCDVLMEKAGWLKEISVSPDWFCADGERRDDDD